MPGIQTYCFARCHANAARRINGFPIGHQLRDFHGHTFRFSALRELNDQGPIGLLEELTEQVRPLDFGYLPDRLDRPTDERIARWISERFADERKPVSVGTRSAPDWTTVVDADGNPVVCQSFEFDASHWLPGVPEDHQCARLHGHHFRAAICVDASRQKAQSMEVYELIVKAWKPLVDELQGNCLNDIPGLENPTSEMLARWIFDRLDSVLPGLSNVQVCETQSAGCEFDGESFSIWKDQRFESAIPNPAAATPTAVTGRGYLLRLHLQAALQQVEGWVYDYGDIRRAFQPYMAQLDHHHLEGFAPGPGDSCLELGQWLMEELSLQLDKLCRIDLFESQHAGVILTRQGHSPRLARPLV